MKSATIPTVTHPCPQCGEVATRPCADYHDSDLDFPIRYATCLGCGLVRMEPRPPDDHIIELYQANYFTHSRLDRLHGVSKNSHWSFRDKLLTFTLMHYDGTGVKYLLAQLLVLIYDLLWGGVSWPKSRGKKILDVGCGDGFELFFFKKKGYDVTGLDFDPDSVAIGQRYGVGLRHGGLTNTDFGGERFDVIRMMHSLEHMPDPPTALKRACELLVPGGEIVIGVPNYDTLWSRWFKINALITDRHHLFIFTPESLQHAMECAGFTQIDVRRSAAQMGLVSLGMNLRSAWLRWVLVYNPITIALFTAIDAMQILFFKGGGSMIAWGYKTQAGGAQGSSQGASPEA